MHRSANCWGDVEEDLWMEEVTVRGVEVGEDWWVDEVMVRVV